MRTLALDTSGAAESVAVLEDGRTLSEVFLEKPSSHSETLLSVLQQALQKSQCQLENIDLFACTVGPGSFTGLRIGISTLKGIAAVYPRPLAPVPTLLALAEPLLGSDQILVPCIDARLEEVFSAAYQGRGLENFREILPPAARSFQELASALENISGEKCLFGPLFLGPEEVPEIVSHSHVLKDSTRHSVRAGSVGRVGEHLHRKGLSLPVSQIQVEYLRASEAENRLKKRLQGKV